MTILTTATIRKKFIDFFASKGHTIVASSPLVPANDHTLLFTNSGMVQFKDVFLGHDKRPYVRATTAQRCLRAGGKHNDLENVGYTARHHTFFEMLGNFSFGDYFKREAILNAWELLTQVYQLPADKLWVTVYQEDDEAYAVWLNEVKVPPERIVRIGDNKGGRYESDNFWQMADTGPCGPCSEIFYDHGAEVAGGPPGSPDADGDRYIEIWNLVFMQFNRDEKGVMHPLPKPSVDTGMGLERLAAVLQHVHSNYEIDLFQSLMREVAQVLELPYTTDNNTLKIVADHIRACAFMVADGIVPDAIGRGYVLRRIIRRAIRHGYKANHKVLHNAFFYRLVAPLAALMGEAYPEIRAKQTIIESALRAEEERFAKTLENGMALLDDTLRTKPRTLSGEVAFKLYDTFGFPFDLTCDICRENNIAVDEAGFTAAQERQRELARSASGFKVQMSAGFEAYQGGNTGFIGYSDLQAPATTLALFRGENEVDTLMRGEEGWIVVDNTPFYAESGGQCGDTGVISTASMHFEVLDTQKIKGGIVGHYGRLIHGHIKKGDSVVCAVDASRRAQVAWNHSATHLLHAALRAVLGKHVEQRGSSVEATRLRFDFSHGQALRADELRAVEALVNQEIRRNHALLIQEMPFDDAIAQGAMALFGEKYGDKVRVITMGDFSVELCGGTHVSRTGDIGVFRLHTESALAAGVRRIEAVSGAAAVGDIQEQEAVLSSMAAALKTGAKDLPAKVEQLINDNHTMSRALKALREQVALAQVDTLIKATTSINGVQWLCAELPPMDTDAMRAVSDSLRDRLQKTGEAIVVLASRAEDHSKVSLMVSVSKGLTAKIKAGDIAKEASAQLGGKGGGRPDFAQAGGTMVEQLPAALKTAEAMVRKLLG